MAYLSLFTFFMIILVTANNFLQMFVGWEGVGVASYLLINFWFTRIQANKSAIKAMLINRIGDFALLIAIFAIVFNFNSLDYNIIFTITPLFIDYSFKIGFLQIPVLDFICILLFLGAMGKSAQIGLHTWLPDAMEGPTPVSALIHAATMVTAGVFLIIRCSYLFENSSFALNVIVFVGSITAFFASTTGLFQNDMKKVIAYSTCSQLGYMVFACGLSNYNVGLFHLANHAFFKALLFLGAGSVIHALSDEQDMRKMGGIRRLLPFSYSIMLVGSLALMGFPFLAGFYSKDVILEVSYMTYSWSGQCSFILGILAAFSTAFYSIRLLYLVFLSNVNGNKNIIFNAHEGSINMVLPLFILCILSIFFGFLFKDLMIGFGTKYWGTSIYINVMHNYIADIEFMNNNYIKLLPLYVTIFGSIFAYIFYYSKSFDFKLIKNKMIENILSNYKFLNQFYVFFNKKWFFDRLYNEFIGQSILNLSFNYFYKTIDRGLIEKVGPYGLISRINKSLNNLFYIHTGYIMDYIVYIILFVLLLILFFFNYNLLFFCLILLVYVFF